MRNVYVVVAGDGWYPLSFDGNWQGVFTSWVNAEECRSRVEYKYEWSSIIMISSDINGVPRWESLIENWHVDKD